MNWGETVTAFERRSPNKRSLGLSASGAGKRSRRDGLRSGSVEVSAKGEKGRGGGGRGDRGWLGVDGESGRGYVALWVNSGSVRTG